MTEELPEVQYLANENGSTLAFLTQIIKDNQLHEKDCTAFSLPKDYTGAFGFTAGMLSKECHCWLDKDNRAPEGEGFSWYQVQDKELHQSAYTNRHYALESLLSDHPELSRDKSSENHWRKTYWIVPVNTTTPDPESKNDSSNL